MRMTLLIAAAAFGMTAAAAHAESEGAGDPFAFSAPGIAVANPRAYADTGSANYPDLNGRPVQTATAGGTDMLPINGSEGVVQTAASLPRGFSNGTVATAQAQSVARFLDERETRVRLAAPHLAGMHRG